MIRQWLQQPIPEISSGKLFRMLESGVLRRDCCCSLVYSLLYSCCQKPQNLGSKIGPLCIYIYIYVSIYLSIPTYLSIYLSVCRSIIYLSIRGPAGLSMYMRVYIYTHIKMGGEACMYYKRRHTAVCLKCLNILLTDFAKHINILLMADTVHVKTCTHTYHVIEIVLMVWPMCLHGGTRGPGDNKCG